jgi:predicted dehydrogenase
MMETLNRPLGVGIVGCGYWGANYIRVFNELPGAKTVATCDLRVERLQEIQNRFPNVVATTQIEELLALDSVDAVVVCTEASNHFAAVLACLKAGRHVLVEKPLTTRLEEAAQLTEFAEDNGLVLMVGHTFIYNPAVRKMKEYVKATPDQVYYLHARRTNLGPIRRDVNALWDLATHDIAIFNYLLDTTPEWVSAVGAKVLHNCREDIGFISIGYPGNILGNIHVSWADPNKARELAVILSDKRIVFNDLNGLEQVRVFEKGVRAVSSEPVGYGEYRLQIRDGDIISPKIEISEPLKNQCSHFRDCILNGERPLTSGREGMDVLRVLLAMDQSVANNGAKVEVIKHGNYAQDAAISAVR